MPVGSNGTYIPSQWINSLTQSTIYDAAAAAQAGVSTESGNSPEFVEYMMASGKKVRIQKAAVSRGYTLKPGFLIGADPEVFIFKGRTPVPASEAGIPGTKEEPYDVLGIGVQVDGMAAEFNIPPCQAFEEFDTYIETALDIIASLLPKGHKVKIVPSVTFPDKVFDAAPDECKALGCQPDINAWTGEVNPPPEPENPLVRCAGGHLHFGWAEGEDVTDLQHMLNCQDLVKQLDWYLGGWSTSKDKDTLRRSLYGKAGACRYKHYGVEYRTLSNFWLATKELRLETWNRAVTAIDQMSRVFMPERAPANLQKELIEAINTSNPSEQFLTQCHFPIQTYQPKYSRF